MLTALKKSDGFTPLIAIIAIAIILTVIVGIAAYQNQKSYISSTPIPEATSTPTPTPSPTPSQSPKTDRSQAPLTPTVSPTPKPTIVSAPTLSVLPASGYGRVTVKTDRGEFMAHVVTLESSAQMVTDTANDSDCADSCPTKPLSDFVAQNGGYAGINGSYFCPASYPECSSKKDSFDFPIFNSRLKKWINSDKLGWGGRSIVYRDGSGMHYMQNSSGFGGGLEAGIINYPGILDNGHITVEAPSLSGKQSSKGTKGGIGISPSKIYLIVATNVDMYDFASVFKALGATHAMNLDGGGSASLYYNGYKVGPGRNLPNAIIFK